MKQMRPHRRNTAHVKYPYIKEFSKISIFGGLTPRKKLYRIHCSKPQKSRFSKIRKILDIGFFYMSSISAMGPHFFHWKKKLWVRGGRSRLALSENIGIYFFRLSMTGSCLQNLPTWETHIKYALVYVLKNQELLLIPWYGVAASSFFPRFSFFFNVCRPYFFECYFCWVIFVF